MLNNHHHPIRPNIHAVHKQMRFIVPAQGIQKAQKTSGFTPVSALNANRSQARP